MAYKAFGNVPTTAYRPTYLRDEARYYGRGGNFSFEYEVSGPLHDNPTKHFRDATAEALEQTALYGQGIVKPDTPVDTGLLQSRWYTKKVRWDEWRLSNDIFYGPFNEQRVRMLAKNLPKIQARLIQNLNKSIPKHLN